MSEKSFSCKDCNKVISDKEYEIVDYEELYNSRYCVSCFLDNCSSDEEQQECIFCGYSDGESYTNCDYCDAFICKTCDEDEDERFITHTISPDFCTDRDACEKRRRQQLIDHPSRYRHPEDKEAIAKLENLS